jgi:iron complex transport system substrate-binding protein
MNSAVIRYLNIFALLLVLGMLVGQKPALAEPVKITDLLGREVTLKAPAKRIVLAQARQLNALGLIHPDPVSLIVGWGSDFQRQNADAYALYRAKFPAIDAVPIVGNGSTPDGLSLEATIALSPDLVLLSRSIAGTRQEAGDVFKKLEAAGIPVAVVDFFLEPLRDTVPSLRILGRLLGRQEAAEEYIHFYEEHRQRLASRFGATPRPSVFMHAHAGGFDCCLSPGKGTFDDFINAAGGRNIAADLLPGATGQISLEQLIAQDPEIYIATGGTHLIKSGGLVLGLNISRETAEQSFAATLGQSSINALSAIRNGRAHGLWHLFNDTPMHVVAIEALAKWIHPELFSDVDPQATLQEISERFSAIPLHGTFWIDATGGKDPPQQDMPPKP